MNAKDIAFPHLGIYLENVPKSFSVFGFEIAFYGVIIVLKPSAFMHPSSGERRRYTISRR